LHVQPLSVHHLPELVAPESLAGTTAVVIDVLRATTTIVYALAAGAKAVVPCLTIEAARQAAAALPRGRAVLAGERGGLPIAGFDLGNSPTEFTPQRIAGRVVVLTTTNGTKALLHCRRAERVLVGAFANLSALCEELDRCPRVDLVCAGTDGRPTEEDLLLAGAIVERLAAAGSWKLDDRAVGARAGWQDVARGASGDRLAAQLAAAMLISRGGRNLVHIGMARDIEMAARTDACGIVPCYHAASGEIGVGR
jgi:2-phosphosulfolactate phosphatase